jgi:(E)-4-hydroxy-3-methylbut-2-enyl-diphosphate synthase
MVESALLSAEKAIEFWLSKEKIILSVKMSDIQDMVKSYELLSSQTDISLHLWLTEAGSNTQWITASSIALGLLLQQWIGDTIRVSITPEPGAPRSLEVEVCKYILQTMWIRSFRPLITSCPWCGRTSSDRFQVLSKKINDEINNKYSIWREKYKNFDKTNIAVMGCIVNGPWEAKHADIWIFFPWDGENPKIPVYIRWELYKNLEWDRVYEEFMEILEGYLGGKIWH